MRVAHLLRKFDPAEWGGTETAIERLASGLAAEDVDSVIYAPQLPTRTAEVSAAAAPASPAGTVRRFRARVPVWGISAERKRQLVALRELEDEGDRLSREAIADLFRSGADPLTIIRWKDIHEQLEEAVDACENAADVLEAILVKNR